MTEQELLIQGIIYGGRGTSNKQITENIIRDWRGSETIKDMLDAEMYYKVKNVGIDSKNRSHTSTITDQYGNRFERKVENQSLSNVKLRSAFMRLSIDQKANYGFSKPFVFEVKRKGQQEGEEPSEYEGYWNEFLTDEVRNTIRRMATDAMNKGIGWGFVNICENGQLEITDIEPETIYPAWVDRPHTKLDAIVRDYIVIEYVNETANRVRRVEYWDKEIVDFFLDSIVLDVGTTTTKTSLTPNLARDNSDNKGHLLRFVEKAGQFDEDGKPIFAVESVGWGRVPFVHIKANDDELPLLNMCRSYIDAHDRLDSKSVDGLIDGIDAVLLLKNVTTDVGDLQDIRTMIQNSRIATVGEDGGGEYLKNDPDITAITMTLEAIKKHIMQFSSTIDPQDVKFGTNNSGEALKMMYQNLDIYLNGLETNFRLFMKDLKYFFDKWLEFRGLGSMEQWEEYTITATLDRDMMINVTELIDNIIKLQGEVSQETRDNQNPWVSDHVTEQGRRDAERKTLLDEADAFRALQEPEGGLTNE